MGDYGIENLTKVIDKLACIFEDGVSYFKDGVQIWDMGFIPKAVSHVVVIAKTLPLAIKESKDLQLEEIAELTGVLVTRIMGSLKK